jgi:hypothetical protein
MTEYAILRMSSEPSATSPMWRVTPSILMLAGAPTLHEQVRSLLLRHQVQVARQLHRGLRGESNCLLPLARRFFPACPLPVRCAAAVGEVAPWIFRRRRLTLAAWDS